MSGCREGQWPRIGPAAYTGPSRQALRAGCQASRFDSLGHPAEASAYVLTPSKQTLNRFALKAGRRVDSRPPPRGEMGEGEWRHAALHILWGAENPVPTSV
jgi:hypothetical protein